MSDEMDISMTQRTPPRKTKYVEVQLPVFNKGTPMPRETSRKDWDEWKRREINKAMGCRKCSHQLFVPEEPCYTKDKLPEKSDNPHLEDREVHYAKTSKARKHVRDSLVKLNNHGFNCAKKDGMAIRVNGKILPKKACKRFIKNIQKQLDKEGNPNADDIFGNDEEDQEFEKIWAPKRAKLIEEALGMEEYEEVFDPYDEFCTELEDAGKPHKIDERHYLKWLRNKVKENEVSPYYQDYLKELDETEKTVSRRHKAKRKLKGLVSGVQSFYRKSKERLTRSRSAEKSKSSEKVSGKTVKRPKKITSRTSLKD